MAIERERVLVTGASAGIGRRAALDLAHHGFQVFAAARRVAALDALRAEAGDGLYPVELDVDDGASIARALEDIRGATAGHGVDAIVNNAGIAIVGPLAEVPEADVRAQFETNVFGLLAVTKAFLPAMMARRRGRIVNVSSSGGRVSLPFVGIYHATKFALEALSDTLRWELRPFGIHVSVIEPGPIRSEFGDKMLATTDRIGPDSAYAPLRAEFERIQRFAEGRMLGPEVVSRDIVHALTARRPRVRYVEPRSLGFVMALYGLAPTWLSEIGRASCRERVYGLV